MKRILCLFLLVITCQVAFAGNLVKVKAIGKSPKGQFIAFEEFGFTHNTQKPFAKIRVMNMWKNQYMTKEIKVFGKTQDATLSQVRAEAKDLAMKHLKTFNISG